MYSANYCSKCGNKIINGDKYCTKCGNSIFKVSFSIQGVINEYEHIKAEDEVATLIMKNLGISDYKIVKPSINYTTLIYGERDLFRIKFTNDTKWIKILIFPKLKKEFENNPLFKTQENKNQVYWQSNIKNIYDYKEILLKVIAEINAQKKD